MTLSVGITPRPGDRMTREPIPRALACDSRVLAGCLDGSASSALDRARAGGLRVGLVYDHWPAGPELRAAAARGDVIAVPDRCEVTAGRGWEERPEFVARLCAQLGVQPAACVVIAGRRPLLAAAAWIGARTVMVPDDATPLFDIRGQRLAPDLATAVDGVLVERGVR
jgi:hypothetical protein